MNVLMKTSMGDITIKLDTEKAPKTAENFKNYVEAGFYDGLIFHRVINGFMIQGGGFEPGMKQRETNDPIDNEANNGLKNAKYTLAMARTMDPHSATGQFFINVADNTFLDHKSETVDGWGYAVFGEVVDGTDVVERIKAVPTTFKGGHQDVPTEDVIIESATLID
ncbi:peptidyl-prolyl cis-trans isomerase [Reinekea forsetii]|nr:peptidyl-prolyl cis-trans isomerase [Reinekea forsetii]